MKKLLTTVAVLIALLPAGRAGAQKLLLGAGGGYATFSMKATKALNTSMQQNLPFSPVLTDNFPGWYFYRAEALYSFPKFLAAGLKLSATSTGSRLHLADYSGAYTFDNRQHGWFPGIKLLLGKAPGKRSGPCLSAEGGMSFSTMNLDEKLTVFEEHTNESRKLIAQGFYMEPGISYLQQVGSFLILSATVSYHLGFESGYYEKGYRDQKTTNTDTGEKITPGWNGWRAGLVLYLKP